MVLNRGNDSNKDNRGIIWIVSIKSMPQTFLPITIGGKGGIADLELFIFAIEFVPL